MGNGRETRAKRLPEERSTANPVMSVPSTMVSAHLCRPSLGDLAEKPWSDPYYYLDASSVREELQGAAINLHTCVDTLKRLHELWDHRYPLDARAIKAIKPFMD